MSDLGFEIEYRPHGLKGDLQRPWVRDDAGRLRLATPEEETLWQALAKAHARVAELEAEAEEHETRKKRR